MKRKNAVVTTSHWPIERTDPMSGLRGPLRNPQEAKERVTSNPDSGHLIADDGQYGSQDRILRANDNGGEPTADSRIMEPAFGTGHAGRSGEKRRKLDKTGYDPVSKRRMQYTRRSSNSPFAISSPHMSDRGRHEFHRTEPTSRPRIRHRRCRLAETGADGSSSNEGEKSKIGDARGSAGDSSFAPQVDRMDTSSPTSEHVYRKILDCRTRDGMLEIKVLWPEQSSWERVNGYTRYEVAKALTERKRREATAAKRDGKASGRRGR